MFRLLLTLLVGATPPAGDPRGGVTYLCQPAAEIDDVLRGPAVEYVPQPGDIFLSTDKSRIVQTGHSCALSGAPHHSGILFARPDGTVAVLESGPFNGLKVGIVDLHDELLGHEKRGEKVWIRRRRVPLTPEQCERLTAWAMAQEGKWFAGLRMCGQLTLFRSRGPLRTFFMGGPHGPRWSYFCSELVMESCVAAGLVAAADARPSATYPRDLFFDSSNNPFLDRHRCLAADWHPPARWVSQPVGD
jgi:hypothetical protein